MVEFGAVEIAEFATQQLIEHVDEPFQPFALADHGARAEILHVAKREAHVRRDDLLVELTNAMDIFE